MSGTSVAVLISVDPDEAERIAAHLHRAGIDVTEVLAELGILRARCAEEKIPEIEGTAGVRSVERERGVGIPPPSSPIQ